MTITAESQTVIDHTDTAALQEYLGYLDALRESGLLNMYGARPFLAEAYHLDRRASSAVLAYWMATYATRHPKGA